MSRYLLVAHQTATSPELEDEVRRILGEDPAAEFGVLVPTTPVQHLFTWEDGETLDVARERLRGATTLVEGAGARVVRGGLGSRVPMMAIADELREHPGYDAIVVGTLPLGVSRWMRSDIVSQARRQFALPVYHVVAQPRGAPRPVEGEPGPRPASPQEARAAEEDVRVLLGQLRRGDGPERRRARHALTELGRPVAAAVAEVLGDPDEDARWEAARTLVDLREPSTVMPLLDSLEDRNASVRWLAAEALAAIGEASVLPLLRRLLQRPESAWLREGAHHVLASVSGGSQRGPLAPLLEQLEHGQSSAGWLPEVDRALRYYEGAPQRSAALTG